ncbi:MAG: ATP phosphoribosyltransferase regulatory subunit, partial [Pseudomonadota bacterium]|nr:ATP phosphoribosyltransferase regulatory subunit [Pseudomonadota bacterium]
IVMNFMGEDVRNRLLFTSSPNGNELCLRPDFTLPLAISYINNEVRANKFVYDGYAFRFPSINEKTRYCPEFRQIGIENFGDKNKIDVEGDVISQAFEILSLFYDDHLEIKISDISMFYQLLNHLKLDSHLFNRVRRLYWRGLSATEIEDSIRKIINTRFDSKPRLDLIEEYKNNNLSSIALIQKLTGSDDLSIFSGRRPDDIVKSYIDKSELINGTVINNTVIEQITEFLSIKGDMPRVIQLLDNFQKKYHIDFAEGIENL